MGIDTQQRAIIGYVVRFCESCQQTSTATVYADNEDKPISERNVRVRCWCHVFLDAPLIVAAIASRLMLLQPGGIERGENMILSRVSYKLERPVQRRNKRLPFSRKVE